MHSESLLLALDFRDKDIAALQTGLAKRNFAIPTAEIEAQTFGVGTRGTALQSQKVDCLARTSVVDDPIVAEISWAHDSTRRVLRPYAAGRQ